VGLVETLHRLLSPCINSSPLPRKECLSSIFPLLCCSIPICQALKMTIGELDFFVLCIGMDRWNSLLTSAHLPHQCVDPPPHTPSPERVPPCGKARLSWLCLLPLPPEALLKPSGFFDITTTTCPFLPVNAPHYLDRACDPTTSLTQWVWARVGPLRGSGRFPL